MKLYFKTIGTDCYHGNNRHRVFIYPNIVWNLKQKKMTKQFDFFLKNFQLFFNIGDVEINYGVNSEKLISIVQSIENSFWNQKKDVNLDRIIWKEWKNVKIPFLFESDDSKDIITRSEEKVIINYDIVASAFYFLSGWNELVNPAKDEFGRIKFENSIFRKLDIITTPVVNYYFDILNEAIALVGKQEKKAPWNTLDFGVCLTHDIDTCQSAWLEGSFSELKKKRVLSIPKLIMKGLWGKDDWFNFSTITKIEKQYNALSSFYFLPQKGKVGTWKNADYNIKSKSIQKTIATLLANGNEIGVHGSFGTHNSAEKLTNDIQRINRHLVIGNRFHFLMFDPLKTVSVLEECGIKYDSSLCFAEHIGFRRGTCYPFYLYNFEKDQISTVIEMPLIVMDSSLSYKKYMGLTPEHSFESVTQIIDEVKKFNGVFTLLWHNTFFSDYKYTGWREIYIKILEYCMKNNGLLTNGPEIYTRIKSASSCPSN